MKVQIRSLRLQCVFWHRVRSRLIGAVYDRPGALKAVSVEEFMKCFASVAFLSMVSLTVSAAAQTPDTTIQFARPEGVAAPPAMITLQDALERARNLDTTVQSALADAVIAREDFVQARA